MNELETAKPKNRPFLPVLIVSVFFGAAAGVVGTLVILAYVAPDIALQGVALQVRNDLSPRRGSDDAFGPALAPAGRANVMFAVAKSGGGILERSYVPGDSVGAGLVLTSDGWLVTYGDPGAAKVKRVQDLVAVVGAKAYAVRRSVRDPYSGAVFLKVDAVNLPVTAFGSTEGIGPGQTLYASDAAGGIGRIAVLSYDAMPAASSADLLRSSERLQRMIRASGPTIPVGAMVLSGKGEVVGIVAEQGGFGLSVVPVEAFSGVIGPVLRDKQPVRPVLGINYVDLSQVLDGDAEGPARGALVAGSADGKRPAVVRKSPAEAAGIRAGDIVSAVDGEPVTAKNPLADVLAEYAAGEAVTLTVMNGRTKKETLVEVTLGASGAP